MTDLETFVETHLDLVHRFAVALAGSGPDADDLAQEVILRILRIGPAIDPQQGEARAYLLTATRNLWRGMRSRRRHADPLAPEGPSAPISGEIDERVISRRLDQALAALPLSRRAVFWLAEVEGLSLVEIARIESISLGTVKSRLHRARREIRAVLVADLEIRT